MYNDLSLQGALDTRRAMAFTVQEVSNANLELALKKFDYPEEKDEGDFLSTLALIPPAQFSFYSMFLGQFDYCHHYKVVLLQRNRTTSRIFRLYHGEDEAQAQDALQLLRTTLFPLIKDGEIMCTELLLTAAVLPKPRERKQLLYHLVEVMEKHPESHPEWYKVVQAMLHSACFYGDKEEVQVLLSKGADLCKPNKKGNLPIHEAATNSSSEGMKWLLDLLRIKVSPQEFKKTLKRQNSRGHNALQVAAKSNNHHVMATMIGTMVGLGIAVGISEESFPLHVAATKDNTDEIWAYVDKECVKRCPRTKQSRSYSLDMTDAHGFTALMVAVQNGYINSSAYLLHGGANPNVCHPKTGDTALHYAAEIANLTLIRMLCVFQANTTIKNKAGKMPIDVARASCFSGAEKCAATLEEIVHLQQKASSFYEMTKSEPLPIVKPGTTFLLSMDGGGVRILITNQVLLAIEKRMKQLQPNCDAFTSYFDYVAGTSAGGVAALMLFHVGTSLTLARALLMRYMTSVLTKPKASREKLTWDFYQEILGAETTLDAVSEPKIMVMCTLGNCSPPELHLMCNYGSARNNQKAPSERKLWEAACATGAAPSHFPAFQGIFLDGGLMANNPTLEALVEIFSEAKKANQEVELGCVLSIGTGFSPSKPVENIDFFLPSTVSAVAHFRENIQSLTNLFHLFVAQVTKSDGSEVEKARTWCQSLGGVPFFRFSPPLHEDISLVTTDVHVIYEMLFNTEKYLLESAQEIDQIAKLLLARKRAN